MLILETDFETDAGAVPRWGELRDEIHAEVCRDGFDAEQYDPQQERHLGNFPQAFSHVMVINTARNLSPQHGPAEERKA
jgi:hypothetical protein